MQPAAGRRKKRERRRRFKMMRGPWQIILLAKFMMADYNFLLRRAHAGRSDASIV
jgi:hypothetical protein